MPLDSTTDIAPIAFSKFMTDPRYTKLANLLVTYSTRVKKGDRVLLDMTDVPDEMSVELIRAVRSAGSTPLIDVRHSRVTREVLRGTDEKHASLAPSRTRVVEEVAILHRYPGFGEPERKLRCLLPGAWRRTREFSGPQNKHAHGLDNRECLAKTSNMINK